MADDNFCFSTSKLSSGSKSTLFPDEVIPTEAVLYCYNESPIRRQISDCRAPKIIDSPGIPVGDESFASSSEMHDSG